MDNDKFKELVLGAIDKLEKQGVPSKVNYGKINYGCFYLNKENNHCCIVGHMMPDDETRVSADSIGVGSISDLWECDFEWALQFHLDQIIVLSKLQELHDDAQTGKCVVETCQKMREVIKLW